MNETCPTCGGDATIDEYGDMDCDQCDEIAESILKPLREMPEGDLKRLAAMMCPMPRMMWPGESISDAQVRQYVVEKIAYEKKIRIKGDDRNDKDN